ncbi:hypothetical protein [Streptomyces anulatus]|uniref:hypothetical protein n=1 Tax=Streptomyces anulatus TaxID=1892 RepID=UPI002F90BEA9
MNDVRLPDRRSMPGPAPRIVLFSDEAAAVARTAAMPAWVRATRSPLETPTWQAPPAPTGEEH